MITLIIGPMYAGKSTELLRLTNRAAIAGKKCFVFKPSIDDRYSMDHIITHDSAYKVECHNIEELSQLAEQDMSGSFVAIDEVQFIPNILDVIKLLEKNNVANIVLAGLSSSYLGSMFEPVVSVLPLADDIVHLKAVCEICGEDAGMTQRLSGTGEVIEVGGRGKYRAVCHRCF